MRAMYDFAERCGERRYFLLAEQSKLSELTAGARKVAATDPRAKLVAGLAVIGASFHIRVLVTMMLKAMHVFYRDQAGNLAFFDTEAEARAWFDAERKRLGLG